MEEKKKQKRSGYSYLRAKIAKQEEEITQLKAENIQLKEDNAYLNANCESLEKDFYKWRDEALKVQREFGIAVNRMGWLRRKIYKYG